MTGCCTSPISAYSQSAYTTVLQQAATLAYIHAISSVLQNKQRNAEDQIADLTKQLKVVELQKVLALPPSLQFVPCETDGFAKHFYQSSYHLEAGLHIPAPAGCLVSCGGKVLSAMSHSL